MTVDRMGGEKLLAKRKAQLETIRTLYRQQKETYDAKDHSVPNRIVSIHRPWVRLVVWRKVNALAEFGAKVAISMVGGYARVERLSWDSFNETTTLIGIIERYREREGVYPAGVLGDKIYRTRNTLACCKKHGIRMGGPKLGRPPSDKNVYCAQCLLERAEAKERNAIEREFEPEREDII